MDNSVEQWQSLRLGKFTASEVYKLLVRGKSKDVVFGEVAMTYIKDKACEILTGETEQLSSKAMEWGTYQESYAIAAYTKQYGEVEYYGNNSPVFIEYSEYSGGSPDAISETHLIEAKCPYRSVNHLENLLLTPETFPKKRHEYYAQMQFNMLLTKKELAHFVSYDPRMACEEQQLAVIEIPADKEFQNLLTERIGLAEKELTELLTEIVSK